MKCEERTKGYVNVVCQTGIGQKPAHQDSQHLTYLCSIGVRELWGLTMPTRIHLNSYSYQWICIRQRKTVLSFLDKPELIVGSHRLVLELIKVSK